MKASVSLIFEHKPEQWGFRGDPYLWEELQQSFSKISLPCSEQCFIQYFKQFFQKHTDHPLNTESPFFVEKYAHGGMSSETISPEFWKETVLPLLVTRLHQVNKEY